MVATRRRYKTLDDLPPFCSVDDILGVLCISRATAYRLAGQGKIPCIRLGRRVVLSRDHLKDWIEQEIGGNGIWQDG